MFAQKSTFLKNGFNFNLMDLQMNTLTDKKRPIFKFCYWIDLTKDKIAGQRQTSFVELSKNECITIFLYLCSFEL